MRGAACAAQALQLRRECRQSDARNYTEPTLSCHRGCDSGGTPMLPRTALTEAVAPRPKAAGGVLGAGPSNVDEAASKATG